MRRLSFLAASLGVVLVTASVAAQTSVSITSGSGVAGGTTTVATQLTSGVDVYGWSWGVCHDTGLVDLISVGQGADIQPLNGGIGPDFYSVMLFPGEGFTVGALVSFLFDDVLGPGTDQEMDVASYFLNQEGSTTLCFCDNLAPGADPIETLVVIAVDGTSEVPIQSCGSITAGERFTFDAPDSTGNYDPGTGIGTAMASPTIAEDPTAPGFPTSTSGFAMGLGHDSTILTVTEVAQAPVLADLNGGMGANFFAPALLTDGFTVGVVYNLMGTILLQFPTATAVLDVSYDTVPATLIGDIDGVTTGLDWTDTLGSPVVQNIVVDASTFPFNPIFDNGIVTLIPGDVQTFIRGDFDTSGTLGLPDAIGILSFLFVPGAPPSICADTVDVNDDGSQTLPDPVSLLNFLFVPGNPPPAPPHPDCGVDPTDNDPFDCQDFNACP